MNLRQKYKRAKQRLELLQYGCDIPKKEAFIHVTHHEIQNIGCYIEHPFMHSNFNTADILDIPHAIQREATEQIARELFNNDLVLYKATYIPQRGNLVFECSVKVVVPEKEE